uniref:Putative secreted salivary gland peptide n=1 Tax=Ixodes ricinus TaxID=34613 RepID=A0A0K8RHC2_IXORI
MTITCFLYLNNNLWLFDPFSLAFAFPLPAGDVSTAIGRLISLGDFLFPLPRLHKSTTKQFTMEDTATFPVVKFSEVEAVRSHNQTGVVIDVREPSELETDGRIPNFHNIPLKSVPEAFELEPKEFETKYNFSKPEADDVIIFSCRSGRRALLAAQRLDKLHKYRNIKVYEGSFQDWLKQGGVIIINGRPV